MELWLKEISAHFIGTKQRPTPRGQESAVVASRSRNLCSCKQLVQIENIPEYCSVNFQHGLSEWPCNRYWPNCNSSGHTEEKPLSAEFLESF